VVKSTPCCTFWIKVVMWKMVQNDRKYPSIHPSIHPEIIQSFFFHFCFWRERERWWGCWDNPFNTLHLTVYPVHAEIPHWPSGISSPNCVRHLFWQLMAATRIVRTYRTCQKISEIFFLEEKKNVTKIRHLLNCLRIFYFPTRNPSRLINYLTYMCWRCPCTLR
jgi:hypothetical protein